MAALLTLLNAAKPFTIDDPIYYALASQIAHHPFDPYGFTIHWYQSPQPAFDVLMVPMLSYWLAVPVRLFGGDPLACKLWLLPFSLLLVGSLYALFRRWARGLERSLVVLTVFSAALLPSFNLMLDVPVLALSLGALAVFAHAVDRDRIWLAIAAGVLAGLASETKYTGLLSPAVLLLYAAVWRRWRLGVLAAAMAMAIFVAWEACMWHTYSDSHFLHHLAFATARADRKLRLLPALLTDLGGVGAAVVLLGMAALGFGSFGLYLTAALILIGYIVVAAIPSPHDILLQSVHLERPITVAVTVCGAYGIGLFATIAVAAWRLARRRSRRDDMFLLLWLALELFGYFVFTPFPAVRRVLGVLVAAIAVSSRLASRSCRSPQRKQRVRAIAAFGAALGLAVYAVDFRDASAARLAVERAGGRIGDAGNATVWYTGHWGLQFYAERAGMRAVAPGASLLRRGDWLVIPDRRIDQQRIALPANRLEAIDPAVEVSDWIPFATVKSYYVGLVPLQPQRGPRYRLSLFRVRDDFVPMP